MLGPPGLIPAGFSFWGITGILPKIPFPFRYFHGIMVKVYQADSGILPFITSDLTAASSVPAEGRHGERGQYAASFRPGKCGMI